MKDNTKYAGLDVSKEKIAVAIVIANEGREEPKFHGIISNTLEAIRKLIKN